MTRLEFLAQAQEFLDEIPAINRGGCAIAALALKRWLDRGGYDTSDIIFVEDYRLDHVLLHCEQWWIDSEGNHPPKEPGKIHTEAELLAEINKDIWNYCFDRSVYVEVIANELDIDLSDVEIF